MTTTATPPDGGGTTDLMPCRRVVAKAKRHPLVIDMITDDGGTSWYYSKGHHKPDPFVDAVQAYIKAEDPHQEPISAIQAVHWAHGRRYPDLTGEYAYRVDLECEPGRGAFPVTWIEL